MKEWFTLAELAKERLPSLPATTRTMQRYATQAGWYTHKGKRRKAQRNIRGGGTEFHIDLLPPPAKLALIVRQGCEEAKLRDRQGATRETLWRRFDGLSDKQKQIANMRLKCLNYAETLYRGGFTKKAANVAAAASFGFSLRSVFNWQDLVDGKFREDWLAALAPKYGSASKIRRECHPDAWQVLVEDYMRPSRPAFSACYRRMVEVAAKNGWQPIPQERVLRRQIEREALRSVARLAKPVQEKVTETYTNQLDERSYLHAMKEVSIDSHQLDVFVQAPWSAKPARLYLVAIQDLFSGKLLCWRLSNAENWEIVRLVIGDMLSNFGIPEKIIVNRAFARKWVVGGTKNRFRFKIKDDDPQILLKNLGIVIQWAPSDSTKSKPTVGGWRELKQTIGNHSLRAGAYSGISSEASNRCHDIRPTNYMRFKAHVSNEIALYNARVGHKDGTGNDRSFGEIFDDSLDQDTTSIRRATTEQRDSWLLASEVKCSKKRSGEIHFCGKRYWSKELTTFAGSKVTIRFDPDNLHQPINVYDRNNKLISVAVCCNDANDYGDHARRHDHRSRRVSNIGVELLKEANIKPADQLAENYRSGNAQPIAVVTAKVGPNILNWQRLDTLT